MAESDDFLVQPGPVRVAGGVDGRLVDNKVGRQATGAN